MASSLARELKRLNQPAPEAVDPETADDLYFEGSDSGEPSSRRATAAAGAEDDEAREPAVRRPEGRRLRAVDVDVQADPRYRGRRVSRKALAAEDDSDDSDDQDDSEDKEHDSEGESELRSALEARLAASALGSDSDELDDDDEELEEDDELDDSESDGESDVDRARTVVSAKPRARPEQEPQHVKNQYSLWCELMGVRIRMQGAMLKTQQLPGPDVDLGEAARQLEEVARGAEGKKQKKAARAASRLNEADTLRQECVASLEGVLHELCALRDRAEAGQSSFGPAGTGMVNHAGRKRQRPEQWEWEDIADGNKRADEFCDTIFDTWHRRTTQASGARKALKAVNRTISEQVNQVLRGGEGVFARSQMRTTRRIGDAAEEAPEAPVHDADVYDDSAFYQQLLLSFVSTSNASNAARVADVDDEAVQDRLRKKLERSKKKRKREVDPRGSKGRKLRFDVHEKLVNFVAPRHVEVSDVDTEQLFTSLFSS